MMHLKFIISFGLSPLKETKETKKGAGAKKNITTKGDGENNAGPSLGVFIIHTGHLNAPVCRRKKQRGLDKIMHSCSLCNDAKI